MFKLLEKFFWQWLENWKNLLNKIILPLMKANFVFQWLNKLANKIRSLFQKEQPFENEIELSEFNIKTVSNELIQSQVPTKAFSLLSYINPKFRVPIVNDPTYNGPLAPDFWVLEKVWATFKATIVLPGREINQSVRSAKSSYTDLVTRLAKREKNRLINLISDFIKNLFKLDNKVRYTIKDRNTSNTTTKLIISNLSLPPEVNSSTRFNNTIEKNIEENKKASDISITRWLHIKFSSFYSSTKRKYINECLKIQRLAKDNIDEAFGKYMDLVHDSLSYLEIVHQVKEQFPELDMMDFFEKEGIQRSMHKKQMKEEVSSMVSVHN